MVIEIFIVHDFQEILPGTLSFFVTIRYNQVPDHFVLIHPKTLCIYHLRKNSYFGSKFARLLPFFYVEVKVNKIMFEKLSVKDQKEVTAGDNTTSSSNPGLTPLTITYYCLNVK